MTQLALNIRPRLVYSPQNFIVHAGAHAIIDSLRRRPLPERFELFFIVGAPRTGRTHLSIKLGDLVAAAGGYPRLADGTRMEAWINEHAELPWSEEDVLIIDDAQAYLSTLVPGSSGPLVNLIEKLRVARARIVLLSDKPIDQFQFDEHVRSRLAAGTALQLGAPAEGEVRMLIDALARQRGLSLSERKIAFLIKRIERSLPAIEEYLDKLHYLSVVLGKPIQFPLLSDAI